MMLANKILATLLLICEGFQHAEARLLIVSREGKDIFSCGISSSPCRSVRFVVQVANSGDTIHIDYAQGKPYKECEYSGRWIGPIQLNKSLSFIGVNGQAKIQCQRSCNLFKIPSRTLNRTRIIFDNLVLAASQSFVRGYHTSIELVIKRCTLLNYDLAVAVKRSAHCSLRTFNCRFEESENTALLVSCINLSVHLESTFFSASPVDLQSILDPGKGRQTTEVFISNCVFNARGRQFNECHNLLTIRPVAVVLNITITSSRFTNHYQTCDSKRNNILGIVDSSYGGRNLTLITLNKLYFDNNYSPPKAIRLVLFLKKKTTFKATLQNSFFQNNTGSLQVVTERSDSRHYPWGPQMIFRNNTFLRNNQIRARGLSHYPTILFTSGRFLVWSCRFLYNEPGDLPVLAVVVVLEYVAATFRDCYNENQQVGEASVQLYAEPKSVLQFQRDVTFNITSLTSNQAIFSHMPAESEMSGNVRLKGTLRIFCPQGYLARSNSQCKLSKSYVWCSYLYISCEQCPPKTYSVERGKLLNNIPVKMQCHQCPSGGQCQEGKATSEPGFWGYREKQKMSFLPCPPGYCCDTQDCSGSDGCRANRTGTLCGQCPRDTSEPLFDTECLLNEHCRNLLFWPGVSCFLILYLLFFLYHKEITSFVPKGLSFRRPLILSIARQSNLQDIAAPEDISPTSASKADSGLLKIIFYYYQIIYLFKSGVVSHNKQQVLFNLQKLFSKTMNFIVINVPPFDCPFQDLKPVGKQTILRSVGPCLLVLLGLIKVSHVCFGIITRHVGRLCQTHQSITDESGEILYRNQNSTKSFNSLRIVSALTHISLLMYSSAAQWSFSLLHCVSVGGDKVLFIDGTIKCYQTFQYLVMVYVLSSILPFCLVPVLGSYLLTSRRISVRQFCCACICPLPFCCFWVYLQLKDGSPVCEDGRGLPADELDARAHDNVDEESSSREAVLGILLGPFRSHKPVACFPASRLPWEGFLIFRRLFLISVLTFVADIRLKMVLALITCVVILVCHIHVKPFRSAHENHLEAFSLTTLVVFSVFTLFKALYQAEDFSSSASLGLLNAFNIVENILIVLPVGIIIFIVIISFSIRLIIFLRFCSRACLRRLGRVCRIP